MIRSAWRIWKRFRWKNLVRVWAVFMAVALVLLAQTLGIHYGATKFTLKDVYKRQVLKERGYELPAHHFAHRITRDEIERTDLFLPMTASHMRALLRQLPQAKRSEVHMYRSFDPNLPKPAAGREDSIDPVSYTHLDVYKRQIPFRRTYRP